MKSLLEQFHDAILTQEASVVAAAVKPHPRMSSKQQLAIYIDGYRIRLLAAIRMDYPALLELLGDKKFDRLAERFIEENPPRHFNLDRYPHGFAALVREHGNDVFAAEIAALEAAIAEVFMLEESVPLDPFVLNGLAPEAFGAMVLRPRTASRLLSFRYPVHEWLITQRNAGSLARPLSEETYVYIYRHQNEVQRIPLTPAAYALLQQLDKKLPLAEALELLESHSDAIAANLQIWFAEWMEKGFFQQ